MNKNFFCLCPRQYMSFTCDRTWVHWQAKNTHICMCTYTNTHKDKQIEPKSTYYAWCTLIFSFVLYLFYSILFLQTKSPDPLIGLDYRIWKKFLQPVFHVRISLLHFFSLIVSNFCENTFFHPFMQYVSILMLFQLN